MATISKLSASLTLNSQAFEARLRSSRKKLSVFGSSVARASRMITGMGAAAAAAAVGGLSLMVKHSFSTIDSTAKMADVLGLTIDQMRGYQLAAQLAGVENAALETGFRRLQKNVSDARLGLTTAQRAFDAIGLSADRLNSMSPDEQFKAVADALRDVQSQSDRARVAQDLLGRSGITMLKLMENGAAGITAVQERSRRLRGELTRLDASKIEAANDAWAEMRTATTGVADQLAVRLAPSVQDLAEYVTSNKDAMVSFASNFADELMRADSFANRTLSAMKDLLGLNYDLPVEDIAKARQQLDTVNQQIAGIEMFLVDRPTVAITPEGVRASETVREALERLKSDKLNLEREIKFMQIRPPAVPEPNVGTTTASGSQLPSIAEESDRLSDLNQRARQVFEQTRTPLERYNATLSDYSELLNAGAINQDTFSRAVAQANQELYDAAQRTADLAESTDGLTESTDELKRARDQLTGMGRELGRFETLGSVTNSVGGDMGGTVRAPIAAEIAQARFNARLPVLESGGGSGDVVAALERLNNQFSQLDGTLRNRTMRASFG